MDASDALLLQRWSVHRDAHAFRELVSRHAGMVYGTCRRVLGNGMDAEEVTQDCFLRLAQSNGRVTSSLAGWLHVAAVRRSLDVLKAESRRRRREERYAEVTAAGTPRIDPYLLASVDEAIAELPERLREPLVLYFLEEQPQDAVAERLGISRSAVSRRIDRAVEQVRKTLHGRGVSVGATALAEGLDSLAAPPPESIPAVLNRLALAGGPTAPAASIAASKAGFGGTMFSKAVGALTVVLACTAVWSALPPDRAAPNRQTAPVSPTKPPAQAVPTVSGDEASYEQDRSSTSTAVASQGDAESSGTDVAAPSAADGSFVSGLVGYLSPARAADSGGLAGEALFKTAETLFGAKQCSMAMAFYRRIANEYPNWDRAPYAQMMIGICYSEAGKEQEAIAEYEKAVQRYPDSGHITAATWFYLGQKYRTIGELEKAQQAFEESIERSEKLRGLDKFPGKNAQAILRIVREDLRAPGNPVERAALSGRGEALHRARRYQEALRTYERVVDLYPACSDQASAMMMVGICKYRLGRRTEAIEAYEVAIRAYPDLAGYTEATQFYLGSALLEAGETARAQAAFERCIELCKELRGLDGFPAENAAEALKRMGVTVLPQSTANGGAT